VSLWAFSLHGRGYTLIVALHSSDRVYRPEDRSLKTSRWKAFLHVLNHQDLLHEIAAGSAYLWAKLRGREPDATRHDDLEHLTGGRRDVEYLPCKRSAADDLGGAGTEKDNADEYSPAPLSRISRYRAAYSSLPVDNLESGRDSPLSLQCGGLTPLDDARRPHPLNFADMPRLQPPRGPNASVAHPTSSAYQSTRDSHGDSERGTFGHRRASSSSLVDSVRHQPRDGSADSFQTAQSNLAHQSPAMRSVQQYSHRLSLDASPLEGAVPSIGLPQGVHLPSAGGVVRLTTQRAGEHLMRCAPITPDD
jgi:hypothetical protein